MQDKKKKNFQLKDREPVREYIICLICGRKIEPDSCSWDDDVGQGPYCRDCYSELNSCGCSD